MMLLQFSMFYDVLFPDTGTLETEQTESLSLRRAISYIPHGKLDIHKVPLVVFDLETTGLDSRFDQIIEIGAQKVFRGEVLAEFSTLVSCKRLLPPEVQQITGITPEMLVGQPTIETVMPDFLKFIEGSLLVAHNASFDIGFVKAACEPLGFDLDWPVFCTLKMARDLLPELERKNLDTLAAHYGLHFEARHRSIGDVKVTLGVLQELLQNEGAHLQTLQDLEPYRVT